MQNSHYNPGRAHDFPGTPICIRNGTPEGKAPRTAIWPLTSIQCRGLELMYSYSQSPAPIITDLPLKIQHHSGGRFQRRLVHHYYRLLYRDDFGMFSVESSILCSQIRGFRLKNTWLLKGRVSERLLQVAKGGWI